MQFRQFGNLEFNVSALGFGCMRLPRTPSGEIDETHARQMIEYAIDHGLNYLDTAYGYHSGKSEVFLGKVLSNGYRDKVKIATKLPSWLIKENSDFDKYLDEQSQRLQTDHIDFYLLHGMNQDRWENLRTLGVREWLDTITRAGRIGAAGFSFHDSLEVFKKIVDEFDGWRLAQIQYNYMNETHQAGTQGLRYAHQKGLAMVIMEPLLGGRLTTPPESIQQIWEKGSLKRSAAEWGLQWLWNQPEVSVVLSGMSTLQQVQENIASANRSAIGSLSLDEIALVAKVRDIYQSLIPVNCTNCKYCLPCPNGVDIPRNFEIFNSGIMYNNLEDARRHYRWLPPNQDEHILASSCEACLECETKCPQNLLISRWMPIIHAVLWEGQNYVPPQELIHIG